MEKIDSRFAELLLESMADGVFTLNSDGKITLWNNAMEKITGYGADEALGKSCGILNFNKCLNKECPSGVFECGIFEKETIDAKKCRIVTKSGITVPILKSARIVKDDHGKVVGIVETITDISELERTRKEAREAVSKLEEIHRFHNLIGKSEAMKTVFTLLKAASQSDSNLLIYGMSGTGKELAAGAVHYNSFRKDHPMVVVNCSALSETLLESELFGHIRGAFTGAVKERQGRFEEAGGGTVFLDEISEISPYIQVKLLRVLQEREIERVGESRKRKIDIRIIAATNKDLFELVRRGEFREDLYYRLKVFPVHLPSLSERKEDIPLLTDHFVSKMNEKTGKTIRGVSRSVMKTFLTYAWPGNIRELENAVEHGFVLCMSDEIDTSDIPVEIKHNLHANHKPSETVAHRETMTRPLLIKLLNECNWNKAEVARRLGYSRTAVWKYMKKWNIPLKPEV